MAGKIVDFSARSKIVRDEPFYLHFWECTPTEYLDLLKNPRKSLAEMGINIPQECRIETTIENHDWLGDHSDELRASDRRVIVCNTGTGDVGRTVYRIISYAHEDSAIGKFKKELLHSPDEDEVNRS